MFDMKRPHLGRLLSYRLPRIKGEKVVDHCTETGPDF